MTFYSEMAQVASDLLGEFGVNVVISRSIIKKEVDPVTGATISEGSIKKFTIKGILKKYPENFIDGSRITTSDRQLILEAVESDLDQSISFSSRTSVFPILLSDKISINNQLWPIMEIQSVSPGGIDLIYIVRVRK